jgi:hypothetical protein
MFGRVERIESCVSFYRHSLYFNYQLFLVTYQMLNPFELKKNKKKYRKQNMSYACCLLMYYLRDVSPSSLAHILSILFENPSLNLWDHMLIPYGTTFNGRFVHFFVWRWTGDRQKMKTKHFSYYFHFHQYLL